MVRLVAQKWILLALEYPVSDQYTETSLDVFQKHEFRNDSHLLIKTCFKYCGLTREREFASRHSILHRRIHRATLKNCYAFSSFCPPPPTVTATYIAAANAKRTYRYTFSSVFRARFQERIPLSVLSQLPFHRPLRANDNANLTFPSFPPTSPFWQHCFCIYFFITSSIHLHHIFLVLFIYLLYFFIRF